MQLDGGLRDGGRCIQVGVVDAGILSMVQVFMEFVEYGRCDIVGGGMVMSWFIGCNRCEYWLIQSEGEFCSRDCPGCYGGRLSTHNPIEVTDCIVIVEEDL